MKQQIFLGGIAITFLAFTAAVPASAARDGAIGLGMGPELGAQVVIEQDGSFEIARRGRGRGGDDESRSSRSDGDNRDRGRGKDDNRNGKHRVNDGNGKASGSGRRKPRIPGGSGCDDPGDILEHAACRP